MASSPDHGEAERYAFTWAGKREAIRLLHTPAGTTLVPCREQSVLFDTSEHLFVEGDNLEALKLLSRPCAGRVKMIYIDPPYNTRGDFVYRDNYASAWLSMMYPRLFLARQLLREDGVIFVSIDDHEVHNLRMLMNEIFGEACFKNCIIFRRGIKNVQAQFEMVASLTVGHEYVLMYARSPETRFKKLYVARDRPKPGTWNNHWRGTNRPTMRYQLFGITPERGQWRWSEKRSLRAIANYQRMLRDLGLREGEASREQIDRWVQRERKRSGRDPNLLRLSSSGKPEHYVPPSDAKLGSDLWTDLSPRGSDEVTALFGSKVFDNPKPVRLIRRMLQFTTGPEGEDIVLDFFAGSCTTAQAVLEANREDGGNRRFIMVQLPEPLSSPIILSEAERSEETLPSGDSSPAARSNHRVELHTIADIGKERIRRVIRRMHDEKGGEPDSDQVSDEDLGFRVFKCL